MTRSTPDALEAELARHVHAAQLHVHGDELHGAHAALLHRVDEVPELCRPQTRENQVAHPTIWPIAWNELTSQQTDPKVRF